MEANYYLADEWPAPESLNLSLDEARSHLHTALSAIGELSEHHQHFWWQEHFKPALDMLDAAPFNFDAEYVAKVIPK